MLEFQRSRIEIQRYMFEFQTSRVGALMTKAWSDLNAEQHHAVIELGLAAAAGGADWPHGPGNVTGIGRRSETAFQRAECRLNLGLVFLAKCTNQ